MNENIYQITLKLKESITSSEIYLNLIESEKNMEEDEEVITLAYQKDLIMDKYYDFLKIYPEESLEVKEIRKQFYEAKKEFESHPKVRTYLNNYRALRKMLEQLNDIIFKDLKEQLCPNLK